MKKNIILIGPPGAGKGSLATLLKKRFGFVHISTGDMFREAISEGTPLGLMAKSFIDKGALVPDDVTIQLVKSRLAKPDCQNGFLLDGFPRTLAQAQGLEEISNEIGRYIELVIDLDCDASELISRISGRRVCPNCGAPYHIKNMKPKVDGKCDVCGSELIQRADDNESALKVRLQHYSLSTAPLLDFYKDKGLLVTFNSLVGLEKLFDEVSDFLLKS